MKQNSLYEPLLIEIAWEVCNKVGGIYTVIQTKVPYMKERWGDQYCLIGPQLTDDLPVEFQPAHDFDDAYGQAALKMKELGYEVNYGYWLVEGKPKVILLKIANVVDKLDEIKMDLEANYGIPIRPEKLLHEVIAFGHMVFHYLQEVSRSEVTTKQIIAHFHEWMASSSLADVRKHNLPIATVFTTHATSLGRYLAMNDPNFYKRISAFDWKKEAIRFGLEAQASIERLAAQSAHAMTTVSQLTDQECEFLLGRKADILLPNGLNIGSYTVMHELQNLHQRYKEKIHEFTMAHFFNNYTFNLDKTLYFFTSGRYEYVNKGYDVTLEALTRLNERMKRAKIDKTVVMFFITKRPVNNINPLVLELRSLMEEIRQTCEAIQQQVGEKLFYAAAQSNGDFALPNLNDFVNEYWQFRYKKTLLSWKTPYLPILVTHNLKNDQDDSILSFLREREFYNQEENPVKIVYHPDFIDSTNPLFKLDYFQFVRGANLGIFPSYYEPWGYTPVECIARGVATITSDLAGFGDYAKQKSKNAQDKGLYIVNRRNQSFDDAAEELTDYLFEFVQKNGRERLSLRNSVEGMAYDFSWDNLGRYYMEAYRLAITELTKTTD